MAGWLAHVTQSRRSGYAAKADESLPPSQLTSIHASDLQRKVIRTFGPSAGTPTDTAAAAVALLPAVYWLRVDD
jgi:hypothetical protein